MRRADVIDLLSDMGFTFQDAGVFVLRATLGTRSWLLRFSSEDDIPRANATLISVSEEGDPRF